MTAAAAARKPAAVASGLVSSCDDRKLFGFPLWPRQRELLQAVEDGPERMFVWALGRRSGKTTLAALVGLWDCLLRPGMQAMVRPGERRHVVCVATSLRQARLFVHAAVTIVEASPLLKDMVESVTEDTILFHNATALSAFPCSARAVRGWPISTLLLDEAAHFISETDGPAVADNVFSALMPATAQFGSQARIIVASTPYGSSGFFAELHAQASSGELVDARSATATTAEMNPTITQKFLDLEQARDPESYRSEYLALFVGGGANYLDPQRIEDAIADRDELLPGQATRWVAGLDPAFSRDPFGLAIVGQHPHDWRNLVLGFARSWIPDRSSTDGRDFEHRRLQEDRILAEVAAECLRYKVAKVVTDQYASEQVVGRLRQSGLHVEVIQMSASSKTAVYGELRSRINLGTLELYRHETMVAELKRLRTKYTGGSANVINPRVGSSHGDIAQALAMSVSGHTFGSDPSQHPTVGGSRIDDYDDSRPPRFDDVL